MWEWISTIITSIQSNPIVAGIFGTSILAGLAVYLRNLPFTLYYFLLNFFTIHIILDQQLKITQTEYFNPNGNGFQVNKAYAAIARKLITLKKFSFNKSEDCLTHPTFENQKPQYIGSIGITYWSILDNILIAYSFNENQSQKFLRSFTLQIRFFTTDKNKVQNILNNSIKEIQKRDDETCYIRYFFNIENWWEEYRREIYFSQNIFMLNSIQEEIYQKIAYFLNNKNKYMRLCKMYHTGFIFYGKPGCGKSQFIKKLVEDFELDLHVLNLNSIRSDNELIGLMQNISSSNNVVLLLEDIDRMKFYGEDRSNNIENMDTDISIDNNDNNFKYNNEDNSDTNIKLSFSTLLNILDGIYTTNTGIITICTTNNYDKLDPAFIRLGRFDYHYEFSLMDNKAICKFLHIQYNTDKQIIINNDIRLPISIISNICFESKTIEEAVTKINQYH